jgi:hypothetical protein
MGGHFKKHSGHGGGESPPTTLNPSQLKPAFMLVLKCQFKTLFLA